MFFRNNYRTIVFVSILTILSGYVFVKYREYIEFKEGVEKQLEHLEYIIPSNHQDILNKDNTVDEKNIKKIENWINFQFSINDFVISEKDSLFLEYDEISKIVYIYKTNYDDGKIHNTPFNIKSKDDIYKVKDEFFIEFLFHRKYSLIIGNLISSKESEDG